MTELLSSGLTRFVIASLVLATVSLVVYSVGLGKTRSAIAGVLDPYTLESLEPGKEARHVSLAETQVVHRAVQVTARMLRPSKILPTVEASLEHAALDVRAAEAVFFYVLGVVLSTLLGGVVRGAGTAVVALVTSAFVPVVFVRVVIRRRRRAFESHLPEGLRMLAASLQAGRSLQQALHGLATEVAEPLASELSRAVAEVRLGRPIEAALQETADRMASEDARFVASAVRLQRQVGGNLAEILGIVAETMVERDRLRGEVRALTAEGRMSAVVLGILPLGLGVFMYLADPDYIFVLFKNSLGRTLLAGACGLGVGGFIWMRKSMEVDV